MTDALSKDTIRHEALLHRDRIDPHSEEAEEAARHFFDAVQPPGDKIIAAYWPKGREFDCLPLIHDVLSGGWVCALPVMQKNDRVLKFAPYRDGDAMIEGPFGIMQPVSTDWVEPDIFVIPLLAFDRQGNRLGYGKGYYDATLEYHRARKDVLAVGYGYGQQAVLFNLPVDETDQKLDWMITPQKAMRFA